MWQDFILSIVGIVFTISLIPQIIDVVHKKCIMNSMTCFITSSGCFVIAFVDFTLNLPYASIISIITGIFWGTMFCYSKPLDKMYIYIKTIKSKIVLYNNYHRSLSNE